jgi:hypothetical protein
MFNNLSTVTQGTLGLSYAIAYLTKLRYIVSIPLVDNQDYDLICEIDTELKKVQVKTTQYKKNENYIIQLRSIRPNRTENIIKHFEPSSVDYLLAVTELCDIYFIPTSDIEAKSALTLGNKYLKYKDKL